MLFLAVLDTGSQSRGTDPRASEVGLPSAPRVYSSESMARTMGIPNPRAREQRDVRQSRRGQAKRWNGNRTDGHEGSGRSLCLSQSGRSLCMSGSETRAYLSFFYQCPEAAKVAE